MKRPKSRPEYAQWPRQRLYHRAVELRVPGRSTMSKGELVGAIRRAEAHSAHAAAWWSVRITVVILSLVGATAFRRGYRRSR